MHLSRHSDERELKTRGHTATFIVMTAIWKNRPDLTLRHPDPDAAIADYLGRLQRAEVAGQTPPPSILNGLGDAHLDKGDVDSAVDYYRQAAEAYAQTGLHDNAIACCRKIRRHAPGDPRVGLLLGRYLAAKGLRADALAELEAFVDRQAGANPRKEAIDAIREIIRLAPDSGDRQEELARLLHEDGQKDAALAAGRGALEAYRGRGDEDGAERVRQLLGGGIEAPSAGPAGAARREPPTEPSLPTVPLPISGGPAAPLEIERTSYSDQEASQTPRQGDPALGRLTHREQLALAEAYIEAGREAEASSTLGLAAAGFRANRHWTEAAEAYRRLAAIGNAAADDFAAWAECARQTGEPSRVLESLSVAAQWCLARHDSVGARRSAEEMILIDPQNATAIEILDQLPQE